MNIMEIGSHLVDDYTIDRWYEYFIKLMKQDSIAEGCLPERAGTGTGFALSCETLARLCAQAKYGARMKRAKGKQMKVAIAAELRRIANSFDPPAKADRQRPEHPHPSDESTSA